MALSRLSGTSDFLTTLSRITHSANASLGEMQCTRYAAVHQNRIKGLHVTSVRRHPDPPAIPLPTNVSEIFANETGRFTPERARDIAAPVLIYGNGPASSLFFGQAKQTVGRSCFPPIREDTHVDSYDCFGAVSLNGTMQSNVPKPFCSRGKSTHLNMPGGQWARDGKYIAEDMQKSHYRTVRLPQSKFNKNGPVCSTIMTSFHSRIIHQPRYIYSQNYSTNPTEQPKSSEPTDDTKMSTKQISTADKLKNAMKDYGSTVVILHIGLSLISFSAFYMAVVSGLDLSGVMKYITSGANEKMDKVMGNSSNIILAYTVHKLLTPVRVSITLALTPLVVRNLRKIGILKSPKTKST